MRLLLDTHALLWWLADRELSKPARRAIGDPANDVFVSAVSAWEIAIKASLGKLKAPDDLADCLDEGGFETLPLRVDHALAAGALPRHHDDPFDRALIAQASIESLTVVTRDERFDAYGVDLLLA